MTTFTSEVAVRESAPHASEDVLAINSHLLMEIVVLPSIWGSVRPRSQQLWADIR